MTTPRPLLCGPEDATPGTRVCMSLCVVARPSVVARSGGPASRAHSGAPQRSFGRVGCLWYFFGSLRACLARFSFRTPVVCGFFCFQDLGALSLAPCGQLPFPFFSSSVGFFLLAPCASGLQFCPAAFPPPPVFFRLFTVLLGFCGFRPWLPRPLAPCGCLSSLCAASSVLPSACCAPPLTHLFLFFFLSFVLHAPCPCRCVFWPRVSPAVVSRFLAVPPPLFFFSSCVPFGLLGLPPGRPWASAPWWAGSSPCPPAPTSPLAMPLYGCGLSRPRPWCRGRLFPSCARPPPPGSGLVFLRPRLSWTLLPWWGASLLSSLLRLPRPHASAVCASGPGCSRPWHRGGLFACRPLPVAPGL